MITIYEESILKKLKEIISKNFENTSISVLEPQDMHNVLVRILNDDITLPIVGMTIDYDYIIDEVITSYKTWDNNNGKEITYDDVVVSTIDELITSYETINTNGETNTYAYDYIESMPANVKPCFTLVTTSIEELIELETIITEEFSSLHLTVKHPTKADETLSFLVQLDENEKIQRSQKSTMYQSIISFECKNCATFFKSYHPAEVAFKTDLQLEIMEKLITVLRFKRYIENRLEELGPNYYAKSRFTMTPEELKEIDEKNKKLEEAHITTPKEDFLQSKITVLANAIKQFHMLLNDELPLGRRGWKTIEKIYNIMLDTGVNIQEAVQKYLDKVAKNNAEFEQSVEKAEQEERAREAERNRYRSEPNYTEYEDSFSAGNNTHFFGNALSTAAGVALGNAFSNRKNKKNNELKDYYMRRGCQQFGLHGKRTCAGCTLAPYCSRCR